MIQRREFLGIGGALLASVWLRPAAAQPISGPLAEAVRAYTAGRATREGRVKIDIAPLVDNGNSVPISISVDSPMTKENHVTAIAVFNEKNPQRDVARFHLTPHNGKAQVSTRIRLAMSQTLVAVATLNDGSCWTQSVDVLVTLASCIEE